MIHWKNWGDRIMYLSRIKLDTDKKHTKVALASYNKFHGAIEEAFRNECEERSRKLWRLDRINNNVYLLLLSSTKPQLDSFVRQFGTGMEDCVTKNYEPFLNRISIDSSWNFRLVANPTICKWIQGQRGKRIATSSASTQMEWLKRQAEKNGFDIDDDATNVTESKWVIFSKRGEHVIKALSVTYEGVLVVKDVDRFKKVLIEGLGREKAYGMGLLTVMKPMSE